MPDRPAGGYVLPEYVNAKRWFQRSPNGGWSWDEPNYNEIRRITLKHWLRCYAGDLGWLKDEHVA